MPEPTAKVPLSVIRDVLMALEMADWHGDTGRRDRVEAKLRRAAGLVYRCTYCGEWLTKIDVVEGDAHVACVGDDDGNLEPVGLCGPVHFVG